MQAMDSIQAQTIMTQTGSDAHKHQTERWKIKKDTQISVFKMEQQTLFNNMKTTDSIFSKFKNLLRF
jgi:hypothetical protein